MAGFISESQLVYEEGADPYYRGLYLYTYGAGSYDYTEIVYRAAAEIMWSIMEVNREFASFQQLGA